MCRDSRRKDRIDSRWEAQLLSRINEEHKSEETQTLLCRVEAHRCGHCCNSLRRSQPPIQASIGRAASSPAPPEGLKHGRLRHRQIETSVAAVALESVSGVLANNHRPSDGHAYRSKETARDSLFLSGGRCFLVMNVLTSMHSADVVLDMNTLESDEITRMLMEAEGALFGTLY